MVYRAGEVGRQRRKTPAGRLVHCCCICGAIDTWGPSWSTYSSIKQEDDGDIIPKFCSKGCQQAAGDKAQNVTDEMKQAAHDKEWRDPDPGYRERNYGDAVDDQKRKTDQGKAE